MRLYTHHNSSVGHGKVVCFPSWLLRSQLVFPSALRLSEPLHPHLHSVCIWLRLESLRGLGTWLDLFNMPALMNPKKLDRGGMPSAPSFLTPVAVLMKSCSRHIELHILLACSSLSFYVHMFPAFHLSIAALVWLHVPEARSSGCTLPAPPTPSWFYILGARVVSGPGITGRQPQALLRDVVRFLQRVCGAETCQACGIEMAASAPNRQNPILR